MPLKRQLTPIDCHNWRRKKNKNPISGYKIDPKSILYKEIEKQCSSIKSPVLTTELKKKELIQDIKLNNKIKKLARPLTLEDCNYWLSNKYKNPISKYTLKEDSPILIEVKKQCEKILSNKDKPKPIDKPIDKPVDKPVDKPIDKPVDKPIDKPVDKPDDKQDEISLYYPDINDKDFNKKLANIYEYNIHTIQPYEYMNSLDDINTKSNSLCGNFEKTFYQHLMSQYISIRTPYRSLLMYHAVGVGKTCSSITLAESFLIPHSLYDEPKIWVIMPLSLKNSFKEQIFNIIKMQDYSTIANQCTGNTYINLAHITKDSDVNKINTRIKKIIKSRYRIFTYDSFATFIENEYLSKNLIVKDKVIIIDEAHNIRSSDDKEKRVYSTLTNILSTGLNNRLVLLSATPMYNEPNDIFDLLYLLLLNDKRFNILNQPFPKIFDDSNNVNKSVLLLLKQLSNTYISYLRGKNPFSFAIKLSPKDSDINILSKIIPNDPNNNPIPNKDIDWLNKISDGIIPSILGKNQIKYIENKLSSVDENNVFNNLQPMNIVYDNDLGEKGFYTFFTRINNNEPINVKYNKKYNLALYPSEDHLGNYSGKFLKLCNFIKKSKGIVVIYSRFIWSGILPIAVCLEHMGFNREGTTNILQNPTIIDNPPKYNNKNPKYCILSSENPEIMGKTNIDSLLKSINNPKNIDGSVVKVILMTPVAGEGLSFYNVREMHLIEPWYHFNRVDQVIGRGIRNCSHQNLPLTDKNVTVFMYASIKDYKIETPDIHAFRIASRKLNQSYIIDNIIRDNSFDCIFMKNINYFPKNIFNIGLIKINTSQNKTIDYSFGDNESLEPKCDNIVFDKKNNDYRGFRKETYEHFIPNIQIKLRNIILKLIQNGNRYISVEQILENINFDRNVILETIKKSVYPYILIDGYTLIPHENGIHIVNIVENIPLKIRVLLDKKVEIKKENTDIIPKCMMKKFAKLDKDNIDSATIALYSSLDSICYSIIVKKIIESDTLDQTQEYIAKILYSQGALIAKKELDSMKALPTKYVGYVDIFNTKKFDPILYINNKYRDFLEKEVLELINSRTNISIPNMEKEKIAWGMFVPTLVKKDDKSLVNVFKILSTGVSTGKKTGINCLSLQKREHRDILDNISVNGDYDTKIDNCNAIALELLKIKRMTLNPSYKPKNLNI